LAFDEDWSYKVSLTKIIFVYFVYAKSLFKQNMVMNAPVTSSHEKAPPLRGAFFVVFGFGVMAVNLPAPRSPRHRDHPPGPHGTILA
jgi:hypothetical protein